MDDDTSALAPSAPAPATVATPVLPPGASIKLCPGEMAFTMATGQSPQTEETKIQVSFDRSEDATHWATVFPCAQFQSWVALYEHHQTFIIVGITIKYLNVEAGVVKTLLISPSVKDIISGNALENCDDILLRHEIHGAGILVMLRCLLYGNDESTRRDTQQGPSGRDFVLYTSATRPAIGQAANLEILTGNFNEEGEFVSPSADELFSRLDIKIRKSDLVFLTTARQKGVVLDPRQLHEYMHLYLYRQNISEEQLDLITKAGAPLKAEESGTLRIASLGEAWRTTTDTKSIAALFLFHEFRYHRKMPKYKPPRDAKLNDPLSNAEKRKPQFGDVNSLCPTDSGINLRVKVVQAPNQLGEALILVGDSSAVVNLRLEGVQLEMPELRMPGTCLTVQNAKVEVIDVYMAVCVDKWGKITVVEGDDPAFAFDVDMTNNKSEVEYELVRIEDNLSPKDDRGLSGGPQMNGDDRRMRGRGGRGRGGRGRGRGGGRQYV